MAWLDLDQLDGTFAKLRTPQTRELAAYWLAQRGERRMPRRADIDPVDLPAHLPNLVLAEVLHDPLRFRLRVVGTALEEQMGYRLTGEIVDAERGAFYKAYARCAEQVRPARDYAKYDFGDGAPPGEFERLLLPLSEDDREVSMILAEVVYKNLRTRQDL